jgi:hypothetical protein
MVTKVSKPGPHCMVAEFISNLVGNLTPDLLGFRVAPSALTMG